MKTSRHCNSLVSRRGHSTSHMQQVPADRRRLRFEPLEDRRMLAVFTVSNLNDAGAGSLRDAIATADATAGADTIAFDPTVFTGGASNLIRLTSGELLIAESLTIDATAVGGVTISGDANGDDVVDARFITDVELSTAANVLDDNLRVLNFSATSGDLTLNGLTVTGGRTTADNSPPGVFPIETTHSGAGVRFDSSGALALTNSTVSGNTTTGSDADGGGIFSSSGAVTLTSSTVSGNTTTGNFASGGGIFSSSGAVTLTSSTVSGNTTTGNFASGGGIYSYFSAVTLTSSTVSGNVAGTAGGGLASLSGSFTIANSIIAGNTAGVFSPDLAGNTLTVSHSLIGDNSETSLSAAPVGSPDSNGNLVGTSASPINPLLGPLADNGGPTQTRALLPGSPALDTGDPAFASPPVFDQRGFARVALGRLDIGAFERQAVESTNLVVSTISDVDDGNLSLGELSLREAIDLTNRSPGADTIAFDPGVFNGEASDVIRLTSELEITDTLTIDATSIGGGVVISGDVDGNDALVAGALIIDVAASETAMSLSDNVPVLNFSATSGDLTLAGLTVTGGSNAFTGPAGIDAGGIRFSSNGNLALTSSTVSGNSSAVQGGGILAYDGAVTLTSSTVSGNSSAGSGGGVYTRVGDVSLTSSTVSGNTSADQGGGIYTRSGVVSLTSSTVSRNTTTGNFASGGGIRTSSGAVSLTSSTVSGNTTTGNLASGGGIYSNTGAVSLTSSTVSGNVAGGTGGGVFFFDSLVNPSFTIANTIIAGNTAGGSAPDLRPDPDGLLTVSHSLIGDNSGTSLSAAPVGSPDPNGNLIGTPTGPIDSLLGPLADNGGPTQTRALLPGSPALDAGSAEVLDDFSSNNFATNYNFASIFFSPTNNPQVSGGAANLNVNLGTGAFIWNQGELLSRVGDSVSVDFGFNYPIAGFGVSSAGLALFDSVTGTNLLSELRVETNKSDGSSNQMVVSGAGLTTTFTSLSGTPVGLMSLAIEVTAITATTTEVAYTLSGNGFSAITGTLNLAAPELFFGPAAFEVVGTESVHDNLAFSSGASLDQRGFSRNVSGVDIGAYEAQIAPSADFDSDGDVDGADFLTWQRGFGTANAGRDDGNSDDDTDSDASDLATWEVSFGQPQPLMAMLRSPAAFSPEPVTADAKSGNVTQLFDAAMVWELANPTGGEAEDLEILAPTAIEAVFASRSDAVELSPTASYAAEELSPSTTASNEDQPSEPWLDEELLEQVFD